MTEIPTMNARSELTDLYALLEGRAEEPARRDLPPADDSTCQLRAVRGRSGLRARDRAQLLARATLYTTSFTSPPGRDRR